MFMVRFQKSFPNGALCAPHIPPHLPNDGRALATALTAARSKANAPASHAQITDILKQVLQSLEGDATAANFKLYEEISRLAAFIHNAKQEIAAIGPGEIKQHHLPNATDELDAVIEATEAATGTILDSCDSLNTLIAEMPETTAKALNLAVTRIYEACNFQDITGQRIAKVVRTLKYIEQRIDMVLLAFGELGHEGAQGETSPPSQPLAQGAGTGYRVGAAHPIAAQPSPPIGGKVVEDELESGLLNGPQLPGQAISQDDIDKLFDF
jgi:chemotaxis protein CheZ